MVALWEPHLCTHIEVSVYRTHEVVPRAVTTGVVASTQGARGNVEALSRRVASRLYSRSEDALASMWVVVFPSLTSGLLHQPAVLTPVQPTLTDQHFLEVGIDQRIAHWVSQWSWLETHCANKQLLAQSPNAGDSDQSNLRWFGNYVKPSVSN